jgi:hypothetical protein
MSKVSPRFVYLLLILLIAAFACNLPAAATVPPTVQPQSNQGNASATSTQAPSATDTATAPPVLHQLMPSDVNPSGTLYYDVDSSGTGTQHRTTGGESYDFNLFERPFTQSDMTYVPNLDITSFQLTAGGGWYYVFINLNGNNPNDPINIDYGVELNKNKDGFGDTLIWAQPPYTTEWTTNGVKVYSDPNHDTGGASSEKSDANITTGAPYPGDGYETVIFDQGKGSDPDLAWVRIDPKDPAIVEFAFKTSLVGNSFMWGAWADAGLKDPSKFNYNDRFTFAQAGSPIASNPNYPIKAIYAVDNTCWAAYGFKPTGYEPHICPSNAPPTKAPKTPGAPPPPACQLSVAACSAKGMLFNPNTCTCYIIP